MRQIKKISVVLTVYNGESMLQNTLQSIFSQKGINEDFELEVLAIDDCSTDSSSDILNQFPLTWERTKENSGGPNKGRNIGLRKLSGDAICIADQDDVWLPNRIQTILPYLEKVPIVTSGFTIHENILSKQFERVNKGEEGVLHFKRNQTFLKRLSKSKGGQNTYLGSIFYSAELKDILFEEKFGAVDFDWILRLFEGQESIEILQSLYIRNVEKSNLSLNEDYRIKDFNYSMEFLDRYKLTYPTEVKLAKLRIQGSMARYYYLVGNMKKARMHFMKSERNLKTVFYFLTSFVGSGIVKRYFNVFG